MYRIADLLTGLKDYAKDYVLENTGLKVLALFITAVLWLSVASRPVTEVPMTNVPIELLNIPREEPLTVSNYDTLSARVYLRGPRDVLDTIRSSELRAFADLSGVKPGVRVIDLEVDTSRLPASVDVVGVEPRSIRVTVERVVEKEVPVIPRIEGSPPPGYEIYSQNIVPSSVHIVGAESEVQKINQVSTETVNLSDRTSTFSDSVAIDPGSPNINIREDSPRAAQLTIVIGEVRKERVIENVPVLLTGAPPTARWSPRYVSVKVIGAKSAVEEITPADITVTADAQTAQGQPIEVKPAVTLNKHADKITVQSVEPEKIRIQ
jgi:YbbR domain-containing protein